MPQRGYVPPVNAAAELDMAVLGPMSRSARDLRLLLSIIADSPVLARVEPIALEGLKIALWLDEPSLTIDPEAKTVIVRFAERLAAIGAVVEPIRSPVAMTPMMFAYTALLFAVVGAELPSWERAIYDFLRGPAKIARAMGAGPFSWAQAVLGFTARHREWLQANEARAHLETATRDVFARYDILLAPVAPVTAFFHDHTPAPLRRLKCSDGRVLSYLEMLDWVAFATVFGLPATAVPIGLIAHGLPVGVQIIGPRGRDSLTLSVAEAIEAKFGGFHAPPSI